MKKILVIEDEETIRLNIVFTLRFELSDYTILAAENGRIGVDLAKEHLPDLVISDIMMPILDGYGVLRELREYPPTSAVPLLFLTAKADRANIREGMNLGADDYLTKPFNIEELIEAVQIRLKKSETVKKQAEKKIEELRSGLSFSLPHEFLTPLNGILGLSKMLIDMCDPVVQPDELEMLKEINISGKRLHRVVENFLLLANLEILSTDSDRVSELIMACTESADNEIAETVMNKAMEVGRENDIVMQMEETNLAIDNQYLVKIINELISNSLKFSEPGTSVTISGEKFGEKYFLNFHDFGRGFTAEQATSIGAHMQFERRMYEQQGMGMGLAIIQKIVELHGGRLTVESKPGEGTTVSTSLPLQKI